MLHERDVFKLLGGFIASEIAKQLAPVREAIDELKTNIEQAKRRDVVLQEHVDRLARVLSDMPVPTNGKDGLSVMIDDVLPALLTQAEDSLRTLFEEWPKPKNGIDGKDGRDGRDGTDGADGKDFSIDEIMPALSATVAEHVALLPAARGVSGFLIDRAGGLVATFSDGSNQNVGAIVGKDGAPGSDGKDGMSRDEIRGIIEETIAKIPPAKDGRDGVDGAGFDDMEMQYDGERSLQFVFFRNDPLKTKQFNFTLPLPLYREVWRAKTYDAFDIVQRAGGMWIAMRDTQTAPGDEGSDWKLCTKRGQDGKQGPPGPPGPRGEPGMDMQPIGAGQWPLKGA